MTTKVHKHKKPHGALVPAAGSDRCHALLPGAGVFAITFLVFSRVLVNGFVGYDDDTYITQNPAVRGGLSVQSIGYALTDLSTGNWHPLTMLSHMLDCTLFGLNPMGHHFTALVLHSADAFLVYLVLYRMTGMRWASVAAALLFGVHQLHVASVAHAAQRKDVFSTFFWLLTMLAYIRYAATRERRPFYTALSFFALGLLSKSMLVTLPFVLLLLDFWPLRRMEILGGQGTPLARRAIALAREKLPFLGLAFAVGLITFVAQRQSGFVASLDHRPLTLRIQNAILSYALYLVKTVWPVRLAAFYPYPNAISAIQLIAAAALLGTLTALTVIAWRRRPYLAVGWAWYVVTLLPVIGIVQVGAQSMADRYSYVPLIGIFVAAAWGINDVIARLQRGRTAVVAICAVWIIALSVVSWNQIGTWRSPHTLWQHAVDVTRDNHLAYCNLGMAYVGEGDLKAAEPCFRDALSILPEFTEAKRNLANVLMLNALDLRKGGRLEDARKCLSDALDLVPNDPDIYILLGRTLFDLREYREAATAFAAAVRLAPAHRDAHYYRGLALEGAGNDDGAQHEFGEVLRIAPDFLPAQRALERVRGRTAPLPVPGGSS